MLIVQPKDYQRTLIYNTIVLSNTGITVKNEDIIKASYTVCSFLTVHVHKERLPDHYFSNYLKNLKLLSLV
jgi:hypothetical protein